MEIPKQAVVSFIEQRMGAEQAAQAQSLLPDQVDHEQHADLLSQFGVNPQDLLSQFGGQGGAGGQ